MIVYNNQQQLTGHCSFQEYSVLLQSPPRNNGNQGQHAITNSIAQTQQVTNMHGIRFANVLHTKPMMLKRILTTVYIKLPNTSDVGQHKHSYMHTYIHT